jgi:hypothetical protein
MQEIDCSRSLTRQAVNVTKTSDKREVLLSYWQSLSIRGALPKRSDFDPRAVKTILSDLFTLECDDKGFLELTFAGQSIYRQIGTARQEKVLLTLFSTVLAPTSRQMLGTVFMHNRPASCSIETIGAMVASHFKGSIALFPFLSDQKTTQAVGLLDVVPYRKKIPSRWPDLISFHFRSKNRKSCSSLFGCFDLRGSTLLIAQSHQFIGD